MLEAARALGRQAIILECRSADDFEAVFATLLERGAGAFVVAVFSLFFQLRNRDKILELRRAIKFLEYIPIECTSLPAA